MTTRILLGLGAALLLSAPPAAAQAADGAPALASRYIDPVNGLSLEQAIARALELEPSLQATRREVDIAQGMRQQASLRPNPSATFEQRVEPAGADNQTMVGVEWPLDLFRRSGRVAVADQGVTAARLALLDRERLLVSDVRMRYGEALAAARDLAIVEEMVTASTRQLELLRSRVEQGAAPLVERDLMDVEVRRLESERLIQAGRTEMALIGLKRLLGMSPASALTLREGLETVVVRESSAGPAIATASAAIDRRPDVREAQARIDAAGARIERARGEGKFDVSVLGSYMRMDSGFPQLGFTSDGMLEPVRGLFHYVSVGAMITVPIFARNQGEIAAAQAERSGAAAAYEAARLGAEAELAASRVEDEYARRALMVYTGGAQKLARQNLSVVSQSYELGRATVSEVLSEQRRYLDLERAFTSALKAAYEARTALNRALGELR